jgi:hypothetical protein
MKAINTLVEKPLYCYETCGLFIESDIPFSIAQSPPRSTPDIRFTMKSSAGSTMPKKIWLPILENENDFTEKETCENSTPLQGTLKGEREQFYPERAFVGQIKNGAGYPSIAVYRIEPGYLLDCHNTARRVVFVIDRDTRWIDCYAHAGAGQEDIELWLFGLVMSFVLQSRGIFTLHAAAVNYDGEAIAFLGSNRYGKSTLAFYFAQRGHPVITDDVLPIMKRNDQLLAHPGSPSMNLWSQTLEQLAPAHVAISKCGAPVNKRRYAIERLKLLQCCSAVLLQKIYFLQPKEPDGGDPVRIDPVGGAQAMIDLLAYTRANSMIELSAQERLLKTYSRLLSQASIRRLTYARGFEHLPKIYEAIQQDKVRGSSGGF